MNPNPDTLTEREEIEMLLPWYATGRLEASDAARVEAYLRNHPEMLRQVDLIREEQDEVIHQNEAIPGPSPRSIDALMAQVASAGRRQMASRLRARIAGRWQRPVSGFSWAAAALAGIVLVQAAIIAILLVRQDVGPLQTASGPDTVGPGSYAIVRFADGATVAEISTTLADLDVTIVDGPTAGGLFTVRIGADTMSEDDRRARVEALRERDDVVDFATVSRGGR